MSVLFFGVRATPCSDCAEVDGKWYCTMNCGPAVPQTMKPQDKPPKSHPQKIHIKS